jgi:hypothetical protein
MQNDGIKKLVETRYGKNIAFSNECEELSVHIKKSIQAIISPQTLRRLLGFIDDDVQPSKRTLHYISMYCGFQNYQELVKNLSNKTETTVSEKDDLSLIKQFYNIELSDNIIDINYHRACSNIAKIILKNPSLFEELAGYLSKNPVSQIYFFERFPFISGLCNGYLIHLKKYLQEKKTVEAKLFSNCLFFLGAYLSGNLKDQKKYLDIINAIQNIDKLHPFPIARKIMSNILYAYEIKDTGSIKHWTKIAFEQENKFQIEWKSRSIFPFYHYLMVDCFNLIGDYETSMKFIKIAELDYKSYNDGTIEIGYYESFDLMKAICLYHLGEKNDAKRILNRTDSSALQFTFYEYHLIHRLKLEIKMCSGNSIKKQKLQKALADLIIKTGFTKLAINS